MIKTYLPYEPDQQLLLPAALQEWLPDDHLAHYRRPTAHSSCCSRGRRQPGDARLVG